MNILEKVKQEVEDDFVSEISSQISSKMKQLYKLKKIVRRIQSEVKLLVEESKLDSAEAEGIFNDFIKVEDDKPA